MLTRRRFTCALIGLVAAAFGSTGDAADPKAASQGVSLEGPLSRDVFRALVGQEFSLLLANRAATLVLVRVDESAARPDGSQFNVVFQGAADLKVLEGTYGVTHATAGTTLLYLRPRGGEGGYRYYEAPFNVPPDTAPATAPTRQPRRYERPLYEPPRR